MLTKKMTIDDAAHEWVDTFSAYPRDMIETLMADHEEDWEERTVPSVGDVVYVYDEHREGEVVGLEDARYAVEVNGKVLNGLTEADFELTSDTVLPMWNTLWAFKEVTDIYWMDDDKNRRAMSECGFRIYYHRTWGYFFGIDGVGYSFFEKHWIPLYRARGLHWHDTIDAA